MRLLAPTTIRLTPGLQDALKSRGVTSAATKDSQHGYSASLRRMLDRYLATVAASDPRRRGTLEPLQFEVLVELLDDPWSMRVEDLRMLDAVIDHHAAARELAGRRGVDFAELVAAVKALSFAERLAVVDAAEQHHASKGSEEPQP